jgi:tetratricopeptide (TPR) repeat protein
MASAEALLRQALAIDEECADAHAVLSHVLLVLERHDEAERAGRRAVRLAPASAEAAAALGLVLVWNGKHEDAVALLRRAMRTCPAWPSRYALFLGVALREFGRFDEGIEVSREALRRFPEDVLVRYGVILLYCAAGRYPEARAEAANLHSIDPRFSVWEHTRRLRYRDPAVNERLLAWLAAAQIEESRVQQ